jgi:hypothetical protein
MVDLGRVRGLVFDASMLINLLATQECAAIVAALGVPCVSPEQAVAEITKDPLTRKPFPNRARALRRLSSVGVHTLDDQGYERFLAIAGAAPPNGLGDGEAASIAAAIILGFGICLDDGKARRIYSEQQPAGVVVWSADLISHPLVVNALGEIVTASCFEHARQFGRMRIPRK